MASRTIPCTTAAEVRRRINVRFGRASSVVPEHLVFHEVSIRQDRYQSRRIDTVAVGMLRRTEYLIHGFEIKVSRADLRQELREPAKSWGQRYCDRWWLALAAIDILRDDDPLPDHWGVIAASGRGLRVYREPRPLARIESGEFRAALLHAGARSPSYRRALGYQAGVQRGVDATRPAIEHAYRRGHRDGMWQARHDAEQTASA